MTGFGHRFPFGVGLLALGAFARILGAGLSIFDQSPTLRMAVAITGSPNTSPQSPKLLLDVRMMLPRSYRAAMSWKSAVAAARS